MASRDAITRRLRYGLAVVLSTLVVTPLIAELLVRIKTPKPPTQMARLAGNRSQVVRVDAGVVLWHSREDGGRNRAIETCRREHPDWPVLALVGSSILYSSGLNWEQSIGARLAEEVGQICVLTLAQPGYHFEQAALELVRYVEDHRVDMVLLEIWATSPHRYTLIGDTAYDLSGLYTTDNGYPMAPLVDPIHEPLFRWSRLYETWVLRQVPRSTQPSNALWDQFLDRQLPTFLDGLPESTRVGGVVAPFLDMPLDERFGPEGTIHGRYRQSLRARDWLAARGYPVVELGVALAGESVEEVRLDTCCHYSAYGAERVADALAPMVLHGMQR